MKLRFLALALAFSLALAPIARAIETVEITVSNQVENPVDTRLFGQFLERASWGEPGPEAVADPQTGALPAPIVSDAAKKWRRRSSVFPAAPTSTSSTGAT